MEPAPPASGATAQPLVPAAARAGSLNPREVGLCSLAVARAQSHCADNPSSESQLGVALGEHASVSYNVGDVATGYLDLRGWEHHGKGHRGKPLDDNGTPVARFLSGWWPSPARRPSSTLYGSSGRV